MDQDNDVHVPLYQKVYRDLMKKIVRGDYQEGDQFPSESELQKDYSVSRITIRRTMEMLQNDGYIHKASGLGTVVQSQRHTLQLNKLASFRKENANHSVSSKLVDFQTLTADKKIRTELHLNQGDQVTMNARIRSVEGEVIGFQRVYVPTKVLPLTKEDMKAPDASLYHFFETHNLHPSSADEVIIAILAGDLSEYLNVKKTDPLIYVERNTYDESGNSLEYAQIYYRADRYQYKAHLSSL